MTDSELNEAVARKLGIADPDGRYTYVQNGIGINDAEPPPYSTSIEAAWEIVEFLSSRKRVVSLDFDETEWDCVLGSDRKAYEPDARAQASTAPRAICEAFLKLPDVVEHIPDDLYKQCHGCGFDVQYCECGELDE